MRLSELNPEDVKATTKFADNNLKVVKFVPEQNTVLNKDLKRDFYGLVPILEFRTIPLDDSFNLAINEFLILFSLLVIVFIMSWLTPLLAILIKMESKGPVFFTQQRNGYNYKTFNCLNSINDTQPKANIYKFQRRSTHY